ncbi:hypothetical protein OsJ_12200 [Oryza sativa Japonica Group]|uniref:Uncharacterized protein n=1 Tax=Oryza sativa subsp. japonica TaxID=39947 RepID=A3ALP0_ORYSJ|nr:hypothetical protein OsJ_12200 [Oryza sativa Japonica Group]
MAVGAEVGSHGCDPPKTMANAVKSKRRYGDNAAFVSPPCAVGPCPYSAPFSYAAPGVAATTTTARDNVVAFASGGGGVAATTPAPAKKRARAQGQFLGADHVVVDLDPVVNQAKPPTPATTTTTRPPAEDGGGPGARAGLRGVQAQALAWRDAALSNRAEATALRAELERALQPPPPPPPPAEPGDAESCCYGDNGDLLGGGEDEVGSDRLIHQAGVPVLR